MAHGRVLILMGSDSDAEVMRETARALAELSIEWEMHVASAHRTPAKVRDLAEGARSRGVDVIVCGAGQAAHLAGVVAAHTTLPVLGVPLAASALSGFDALLSTVQMPPGIPVATFAVGKPGARNAGLFAAQILAVRSPELAEKLAEVRRRMAEQVEEKDRKLDRGL